ncbi:acetyl-CoA C-acetyltransferase [Halopseudomonas xinjiangensis]|uniref:Acetyl-CoA C-acetyltransferase n=1 Tax=Halopseudomonas xinjiangensis TaxID=487184 RepID=A0A1H1R598_9GAMM|nr:beta-ketothiolase BktB [Halopseudomonas xinjiangensis]SDS30974.1 acetyl-CoA C-acetyltransferase [Halopseudomonas xinjiangensis]
MNLTDVVILDGARTAIGSFGGSLSAFSPAELGTFAANAAIERAGVAAEDIDHAVFGHIIPTGPEDAYVARHIALNVGMPTGSAALNVNRLCGSAVQSVISAAQMIVMGDSRIALAGGTECMSQGAYMLPNARKGLRMGDGKVVDMTVGILSDPFGSGHMGLTAERIAAQYGLTRADLDAFAAESQVRAGRAIANGHFKRQIVPVPVKQGRNECMFHTDEHVRPDTTIDSLAKLKPAFKQDGVVTPGNASGINDGAAALVLTSAAEARNRGLKPRARLVGYAFCGVNPDVMGLGPIPAVEKLLTKTGLAIGDLDVIESNEAFAAQALAVSRSLRLPAEKVNPNGGAIALGHPVGATGSILIIKAMAELDRVEGRYGLITMCIGGGQGIALMIERLG